MISQGVWGQRRQEAVSLLSAAVGSATPSPSRLTSLCRVQDRLACGEGLEGS